jgi:molybdopterin synthase sulfur carrier subunit
VSEVAQFRRPRNGAGSRPENIGGKPSVEVEIEPGQTIRQVLASLGVPAEQTRIIFVNNRAADLSHVLQGGEQLGIFPAIGGG